MKITIVTAFYEIKSKYSVQQYWKWILNLCNLPVHLIIFTSPYLVDKFTAIRQQFADKTNIQSLKFTELFHYKFSAQYSEHKKQDTNKQHTPELYIIWAEKAKFVEKAININPFDSTKFVWCDIGIIRDSKFKTLFDSVKNEPLSNHKKILDNKITMLSLQNFINTDKIPDKFGIMGQKYGTVRIGGGVQAGDIIAWRKYNQLWDDMLQKYFSAKRFGGQDQCIIGSIYLEHSELFNLIPVQKGFFQPWGYLLYYLY
jgi:hypothetical protein